MKNWLEAAKQDDDFPSVLFYEGKESPLEAEGFDMGRRTSPEDRAWNLFMKKQREMGAFSDQEEDAGSEMAAKTDDIQTAMDEAIPELDTLLTDLLDGRIRETRVLQKVVDILDNVFDLRDIDLYPDLRETVREYMMKDSNDAKETRIKMMINRILDGADVDWKSDDEQSRLATVLDGLIKEAQAARISDAETIVKKDPNSPAAIEVARDPSTSPELLAWIIANYPGTPASISALSNPNADNKVKEDAILSRKAAKQASIRLSQKQWLKIGKQTGWLGTEKMEADKHEGEGKIIAQLPGGKESEVTFSYNLTVKPGDWMDRASVRDTDWKITSTKPKISGKDVELAEEQVFQWIKEHGGEGVRRPEQKEKA